MVKIDLDSIGGIASFLVLIPRYIKLLNAIARLLRISHWVFATRLGVSIGGHNREAIIPF